MTFQALDGRGNHFLDLLDDDLNAIEPHQVKGGLWLQLFGHSNSLCARATKVITNHAPIGEYRLWFFLSMDFSCPRNNYPIESRRHTLHECERFNGYWNPRCYDSMLKELSKELTLVLSDTRELDRVPDTK